MTAHRDSRFQRLVREIAQDFKTDLRFQSAAIGALQVRKSSDTNESSSFVLGGIRSLPRRTLRGHQLVRHSRQTRHDYAKGHSARQKNPRRESINVNSSTTNT